MTWTKRDEITTSWDSRDAVGDSNWDKRGVVLWAYNIFPWQTTFQPWQQVGATVTWTKRTKPS